MELHDYLGHGHRALSSTSGGLPDILTHATDLSNADAGDALPGLNAAKVTELKLAGNRDGELYRMLLVAQCNALSRAMPFLFERIDDDSELLLPDNLLRSDSVIAKLAAEIPEEDWAEVEIIGWLYQLYISEKKDQVIGKVLKSEDTPYDFGGFDRRFIHRKLYLEDVVGESVEVAICIDTSGSIGGDELGAFMGEIQGILDAYPQIHGSLFFADAALHGSYEFSKDVPMPKARGGGRTAFEPFFDWVAKQERAATQPLCIYFTDGYVSFPPTAPESTALWVVMPGGLESNGFPFGDVVLMVS